MLLKIFQDVDYIIRKAKKELSEYVKQDRLIRFPRINEQPARKVTNC